MSKLENSVQEQEKGGGHKLAQCREPRRGSASLHPSSSPAKTQDGGQFLMYPRQTQKNKRAHISFPDLTLTRFY